MTASFAFSFALALALACVSASSCFNSCRFTFCDNRKTFKVGKKSDVSFTGPICAKSGIRIGHIDETGEARLKYKSKVIRISKWHPSGLKQRFSPSFFKSFDVIVHGTRFSGIGHETPQQNQGAFLNSRCFAVPLRSYQVLDKNGNVVKNVHPRGQPLRDCVAFRTVTY